MQIGLGLSLTRKGTSGPSVVLPARLATFGDSTVAGVAATTAANRWTNIRATQLGLTLLNQGISGTVMQNRIDSSGAVRADNGRGRYVAALLGANLSSRYELLYGLNDLRYTGGAPSQLSLANFIIDYGEVIDGLKGAGVPAANITIGSPVWIPTAGYSTGSAGFTGSSRVVHEQYIAALYTLAYQKGTKYAAVYEYMRDNGSTTLVDPDNIHPNDAGMAAIATAFAAAVVPATSVWPGTPVDSTAPTFVSAVINNSTPDKIVLSYNEALSATLTGSATVAGKTVSSSTVVGSTVEVVVSVPFVFGDTPTISTPAGFVRDAANNQAVALTSQAVTNGISGGGTPTAVVLSSQSASMTGNSTTEQYIANAGSTTLSGIGLVGSFTVGTEAILEVQYPNNTDAAAVVVFDEDGGLPNYDTNRYLMQFIPSGAVYQSYNSQPAGTLVGHTMTPTATTRARLRCATDGTVTIETTTNDGGLWTTRYTFATLATGTYYCRIYVTQVRKTYQPRQVGIL